MKIIDLALFTLFLSALDHAGVMASRLNDGRQLDSVCEGHSRLMFAVKCNDDSITLHCGPNNHKIDYCANPNDRWLESKCNGKSQGGFKEILTYRSGCYSNTPEFWKEFAGIELSGRRGACGLKKFDPTLYYTKAENLGFEDGNFDGWDVRAKPSNSAKVICDEAYGKAFEGNCYAYLDAGDHPDPSKKPNKIERVIEIPPVDSKCVPQVPDEGIPFCISFAYRFIARDTKNDWLKVYVKLPDKTKLLDEKLNKRVDTDKTGDSGWRTASLTLDPMPAGVPVKIEVEGIINNARDDSDNDSIMLLDGYNLSEGECQD